MIEVRRLPGFAVLLEGGLRSADELLTDRDPVYERKHSSRVLIV